MSMSDLNRQFHGMGELPLTPIDTFLIPVRTTTDNSVTNLGIVDFNLYSHRYDQNRTGDLTLPRGTLYLAELHYQG